MSHFSQDQLNQDQLNQNQLVSPLQIVEPEEINRRLNAGDTFVVNVVTAWCPDCTVRQKPHINGFTEKMQHNGIDVLQVNVQLTRGDYISSEHEQLTDKFGGRGFPRTVLIRNGIAIDTDNVEIITEDGLSALAMKFAQLLA